MRAAVAHRRDSKPQPAGRGFSPARWPTPASRCTEAIDQLLADAPGPIRNWTARDIDTAPVELNHPTNTTTSTHPHSMNLNSMQGN